jgi:hypothetical protein
MAEDPHERVAAIVAGLRADLDELDRDGLRAADPAGELTILAGALERVVGRLEERLGQLGAPGATPVSAPARSGGTAPPAAPGEAPRTGSAFSEVSTQPRKPRLSPPAMMAYDMLQDGATRQQVAAYLQRHFKTSAPDDVLAEVDAWMGRGRGG